MNKFMDWLTDTLAPATKKFFSRPYIHAVASAMQKILPFILAASVIYVYNVFRAYLPALPDLSKLIDYTYRFLGIIVAFTVASQIMDKLALQKYVIHAGLTAILVFIVFLCPSYSEDGATILFTFARFGPTGMFVSLAAGILTGVIYHLFSKLHLLENNDTLPDFISEWINNIIPILLSVGLAIVLVFSLKLDIFNIVQAAFMPLQNFMQSLPGMITLSLVQTFFFTMGISPWVWGAIRNPVFAVALAANIAAAEAGQAPAYIVTYETMFAIALITMGGQGSPLPLNVLMLKSKSKRIRTLGKVCIGPTLFNISEPIMYGAPIVFNPLLMIPAWAASVIGPVIVWCAMKFHLLAIPSMSMNVGQIPAPISTVMVCQDWRGVIWYAVLFIVYLAIWYPFFKVWDTQEAAKEQMQKTISEETL
ncbi:MAG: PTS sugar transporter subunit IIC [Lachnospiraceae bacterium]|nr:PTS sugar transporter subunit IIC [Lachnospiraceae bacterium]